MSTKVGVIFVQKVFTWYEQPRGCGTLEGLLTLLLTVQKIT